MIMLDASVLIAVLDADDPHHAAARSVLADESGTLAMSVLTLAEVGVGPSRVGRTATLREAVDALAVRVVPLDADHWAALRSCASPRACACRTAASCTPP